MLFTGNDNARTQAHTAEPSPPPATQAIIRTDNTVHMIVIDETPLLITQVLLFRFARETTNHFVKQKHNDNDNSTSKGQGQVFTRNE